MTDGGMTPDRIKRGPLLLQAAAALAVVLVVLGALIGLSLREDDLMERSRQLASGARAHETAARDVLDALRDIETGQRGFLLVQAPAYLEPYLAGKANLGAAFAQLDAAWQAGGESAGWLRDEVAALHTLADRKVAEVDATLGLARAHDVPAALALVKSNLGRATMDHVRARVGVIVERTRAEYDGAVGQFRRRERTAGLGGLVAACIGGALLVGGMVALLVNRARLVASRASLSLQSSRLAAAAGNMRDGVAMFDADGRLLLWNSVLRETTGLPWTLFRAGTPFERFAEATTGWPGTPLAAPRPGGVAVATELRVGARVLDVWRGALPDGGQLLAVADITRRAEAEEIGRQAMKMEALGQLTGGVAHDFNNHLQIISANLEMIGPRVRHDEWVAARLDAALSGVGRAAQLTRHLLAFARRQPLAPEPTDLTRLLSTVSEVFRRTLGEAIAVETVLGDDLWPVRIDPQQLENALLNLAINARDAMPDGGRLVMQASNAYLDDDHAARDAEVTPGQYVVIALTDSGTGMSADQLARALEPFYTTKEAGRGTGLGLSMVYGFSQQSGGHFKLASKIGQGTTARLYLPRSHTAPHEKTPEATTADAAHGELVLLVEDDAVVRLAAADTLRGLGYRVVAAANAAAALTLLDDGARPDLLFTDVVMPGLPGSREMAERAQAMLPGLAVVFTSGYTKNAIVHDGQLDPGMNLISKPWRVADLARRLRQALDGARQRSGGELRIVLAEDDALVRMGTADMLADLGHHVTEASTGAEALRLLADCTDVLISDLGLPDMDGLTLVARAQAMRPDLRVIIASGRDRDETTELVWLTKPFNRDSLRGALAAALAAAPVRV